jgi:hypothetical protein
MAPGDTLFEIEKIKELALIALLPTHHGEPPPLRILSRRNHRSPKITRSFSTASTLTGSRRIA